MLVGDPYLDAHRELVEEARRAQLLLREYNATSPRETAKRWRLLVDLLSSVGEGTQIRLPLYCDSGYQTHIGARTF